MSIVSHPTNKAYRDNFDATFGEKDEPLAPTGFVCHLCTSGSNAVGMRLEGEHTRNGGDADNGFPAGTHCINEPTS